MTNLVKTPNDPEDKRTYDINSGPRGSHDHEEVVFLIPVYNTEPGILKSTVVDLHDKIRKHTRIVVVDDGSYREETKNALEELKELEGVAVIHSRENRGKVKALLLGLEYIKENFKGVRCVFILDDDVLIELPYSRSEEDLYEVIVSECVRLNGVAPVVVFPARSQSLSSYIEKLQDMEHLLSTHIARLYLQEAFHSKISTESGLLNNPSFVEGIWVNGSGSLWLIDELREVLESHSGEHDGDDLEMTLILRRRKKMIRFSDKVVLYAKLKSRLFEYFKQRARWSRGALRLLFAYHNEVLLHYAYLLYVMAPILLYLDVADLLLESYIADAFPLRCVLDVLGIAILAMSMASFLRTIKFFEDVGEGRMVEERLAERLVVYAKIFKRYPGVTISECLIPMLASIALLLREQIPSTLRSIVRPAGPYVGMLLYFVFLSASVYFTYRLLGKYQHRLCYVYGEGVCGAPRITLFKDAFAYSLYILFYTLVMMPVGYLYMIFGSAFRYLKSVLRSLSDSARDESV